MNSDSLSGIEWEAALQNVLRIQAENSDDVATAPAGVDAVVRSILDSRWRRSAVDSHTLVDIRSKVASSLDRGKAVEFSIPFGGYKNWRLDSQPLPDWSEVFCLSYLRGFFSQVASLLPQGVDVHFSFCTGVMDLVSNLPNHWQSQYLDNFDRLLRYFSTASIRFHLVDIAGHYISRELLVREILNNYDEIASGWNRTSNRENREKRMASAARNIVINGVEDFSELRVEELGEKIEQSAIYCEALDNLSLRRRFNKFSSRIQLVFVRGPALSVHIGSSMTSANHFWVCAGVLDVIKYGRICTRTLSASSLADMRERRVSVKLDTSRWSAQLSLPSLSSCLIFL